MLGQITFFDLFSAIAVICALFFVTSFYFDNQLQTKMSKNGRRVVRLPCSTEVTVRTSNKISKAEQNILEMLNEEDAKKGMAKNKAENVKQQKKKAAGRLRKMRESA